VENKMNFTNDTKSKMQAALEHFKQDLKSLRSNRASPAFLDSVTVEVYGTQMRLKDMATIATPELRQLLITPFDPQTAGPISKAIEKANLNIQPILEGGMIRINFPPLDESIRKDVVKQAKKKAEDAKISIREIRRKSMEAIKKGKTDGTMTEDDMKKNEKSIQELTDQFCRDVESLLAAKEKEIMTV
jgi:ribosome recycling factor